MRARSRTLAIIAIITAETAECAETLGSATSQNDLCVLRGEYETAGLMRRAPPPP